MAFRREGYMILAILAGFLVLSSVSFLWRRAKLRAAERRTDAAWARVEQALGDFDAELDRFLAARAATPGWDPARGTAIAEAARALREAPGPQAKAVAFREVWRLAGPFAAGADGETLRQARDRVEKLGAEHWHTVWYYNVLIRKSPDTRVVESLGLRAREFFRPPDADTKPPP